VAPVNDDEQRSTMPDNRPTYDIAAAQIAEYVQPLGPGALAMPFELRDEDGRRLCLDDDHLSGRYLVLLFLNGTNQKKSARVLRALAERRVAFEQYNSTLIAISADSNAIRNRELKDQTGFTWPIAGDSTGAVFASYGLHKGNEEALRMVLLTPARQVRAWFDTPDSLDHMLSEIMKLLQNGQAAEETRWGPPHAPVLVVPSVLSADECGQLIRSFETGGPFMVRPPRPGEMAGDYKIPVYEHDRQDRVDQIIRDKNTLAFLDQRIWERITPMIKKAFGFEVTRREELHIARYVGERGGHRMGHRDNVSAATSYRRFALSMNLNDDFTGGAIVFREFSPRGYRLAPGAALIFSSSLLHEVQETSEGVRYALISHFFNEQTPPVK
jgi:peroxiredoxin